MQGRFSTWPVLDQHSGKDFYCCWTRQGTRRARLLHTAHVHGSERKWCDVVGNSPISVGFLFSPVVFIVRGREGGP